MMVLLTGRSMAQSLPGQDEGQMFSWWLQVILPGTCSVTMDHKAGLSEVPSTQNLRRHHSGLCKFCSISKVSISLNFVSHVPCSTHLSSKVGWSCCLCFKLGRGLVRLAGWEQGCGSSDWIHHCPYWKEVIHHHPFARSTCTCTPVHDLYGSKFVSIGLLSGAGHWRQMAGKLCKSIASSVANATLGH